jgi:ABC-type multidrug transport system fused ATPase/permease subunit
MWVREEPDLDLSGLPIDVDAEDIASLDDDEADETAAGRDGSPMLPRSARLQLATRWTALLALIGAAEGAVVIAYAFLLRASIDALIAGQVDAGTIVPLVGGVALIAMAGAAVRSAEFAASEWVGYRYVAQLRMAMYAQLLRMPRRSLLQHSTGGVLLRFLGDLTTIRTWVSRGLGRAITAVCTLAAGLAVIAHFDPHMVVAASVVLIAGGVISLGGGSHVRRATRNARRQRSNLATNLADQLGGLMVVQTMGRTRGEYDRFGRQNARLTRHLLRNAMVRALLRAIAGATATLAVAAVLLAGAIDVALGRTSVGAVVAAMIVVRQLIRPVRTLGLAHEYWQAARVSREKIASFLRRPYRETFGPELAKLQISGGRIEFRDVHVGGALHGVRAVAQPGRIVAIVGPNGAGKSSLLAVVARIADPDAGEVRIDGQLLTACTLRSCAARISIVGPQLPLMRGTLRRNLSYRWPGAPEAELARVIRLCGLDELIARLPGGLDAAIKEDGANLSTGEAARIALARALVGAPKVLLLDEPTASLDAATRAVVHAVLRRTGGTVLIATHDPIEAALADEVWRMEAGRVVEVIPGAVYRERVGTRPAVPAWARG